MRRVFEFLLALMVVVSLIMSSMILYGLLRVRKAGLAAIEESRAALSDFSDEGLQMSIPINQTFPISAQIPLQQDFRVPIQTTIPISTSVRVPIELPIVGTYQVEIPVETEVPVDLEVVVPISKTVRVETEVTLDTELPVQLEVEQLGLGDLMAQVDEALAVIESELRLSNRPPDEP